MVNPAVDTLVLKRAELVGEQARMNEKFNAEIEQLESAIILIAEGRVWETPILEKYEDENPNYIKQSLEEI